MTGLIGLYKDLLDQQFLELHRRSARFVDRYTDLINRGEHYQAQDYLGYFDLLDVLRPKAITFATVWGAPFFDDVLSDELLRELEQLLDKAGFN